MTEKENNESKISSIHTFEGDLASAINDKNYGKNIIKIITDPKKDNNLGESREVSNKKYIYIIIAIFSIIILVIIGIFLYNFIYKKSEVGTDPSATTTDANTPIIKNVNLLNPEIIQSTDFSKLNRGEIITEIGSIQKLLLDKKISPNNNIEIKTNLNIVQFFEKIKYSGEDSLIRSFEDAYTFGLYSSADGNFDTYILIKINDFDLAFKSILYWEKYMMIDLKDIFKANNYVQNATTTSFTKDNTNGFVDIILKNYDTRQYINNEENVEIVYGFINNKYLLLTSDESSFVDIKNRLLKENIPR